MADQNEIADRLVKEAEAWIGTPFEHQGSIKGVGVDCVHFIDVVAEKSGLEAVQIPKNYNPKEDGSLMLQLLQNHLEYIPKENRQRGDIIAFTDPDLHDRDRPSHIAFVVKVTPQTTYIIEAGRRGVVRHRLDGLWNERIHSVWRIKPS